MRMQKEPRSISVDIPLNTAFAPAGGFALAEERGLFFDCFRYAPIAIIEADASGTLLDANSAALKLLGYNLETLRTMRLSDLHSPSDKVAEELSHLWAAGGVHHEVSLLCRDGSVIPADLHGFVLSNGRLLGFFEDITRRKLVEQELQRYRHLLEAFINYAPAAIAMLNREMRYIRTSRKWRQELGLPPDEPLAGKLHHEIIPNLPEKWTSAQLRALAGETVIGEDNWTTPAGREVSYHWEVHPWGDVLTGPRSRPEADTGGIMILFEDVMKQRQLEAQLRQAQKMEAVGQLAGGLAHDFNNLLQVILGYGELLQEQLAGDEKALQRTSIILDATHRAARLTHQLLAFSRKQILHPAVINLNAVVESTTKMLKRLLPENIKVRVKLSRSLWPTEADPDQMTHVLINLAVNARDAMPQGGTLLISTRNIYVSPETPGVPPTVKPGRYVMVTVRDTGIGIDAEGMSHLFEPFYTTKPIGKGTGLGLASVYGILRQSSAFVWADSSPGEGACFTVCLPRTSKPEPA
jgi:PAS domain S-box-containing protein